ncbi:MAG TPA: hypothetical protein VMW56_21380 [Candidatus Margulisiibacteriota bacterium]|nr:hypothetical protein [Candidatus Margulisiibacteriota bacterium]
MKRAWLVPLVGTTLGIISPGMPVMSAAAEIVVASQQEAAQALSVRDLRVQGDAVSGVLANESSSPVSDVGLLVRYTWFWNSERHPGAKSPGRADLYRVNGPIPPGASIPFTYRPPEPLPQRSDGHFSPVVEVVSFTQMGSASARR